MQPSTAYRRCRGKIRCSQGQISSNCCKPPRKKPLNGGDQFIASELFLLAVTDAKSTVGDIVRENGLTHKALETAIDAVRGGQLVDSADAKSNREEIGRAHV